MRVNSIHPGTTDTDMGDQVVAMRARHRPTNDSTRRAARHGHGCRSAVWTVADIAKGIVFWRPTMPVS